MAEQMRSELASVASGGLYRPKTHNEELISFEVMDVFYHGKVIFPSRKFYSNPESYSTLESYIAF